MKVRWLEMRSSSAGLHGYLKDVERTVSFWVTGA